MADSYNTEYCSTFLKRLNEGIKNDIRLTQQSYYQQYGTYDGYIPTQNTVVANSDGSFTFNILINGQITSQNVGAFCCKTMVPKLVQQYNTKDPKLFPNIDINNIYWDNDSQKCRWKESSNVGNCTIDTFKIVLNPNGNDGSIFEVDDDKKDCKLIVEFDYLFKLKCETLSDILNPKSVVDNPRTNSVIDIKTQEQIKALENEILKLEAECEQISNKLDIITQDYQNSYYSVVCDNVTYEQYVKFSDSIGTKTQSNTNQLSAAQASKVSFDQTAFRRSSFDLTTPPFSFPIYGASSQSNATPITIDPNTSLTLCISEIATGTQNGVSGLQTWANILGTSRYQRFLDGDPTSYTCDDVIQLAILSEQSRTETGVPLAFECTTPFGYKSQLKKEIETLTKQSIECDNKLKELQTQLEELTGVDSETTAICKTPTEVLETLDVSATVDIVEPNGLLTTVFEDNFFPAIGANNLYFYLANHPTDSGFYICGEPKVNETFATGCTAIVYQKDELTGSLTPVPSNCESDISNDYYCNVQSCIPVKDSILETLFTQSTFPDTLQGQTVFKEALSQTILASNWLKYTTEITDPNIISSIKNKKITLSIKINDICSNICVLIDNIRLNKVCVEGEAKTITISTSPGFELDRIIDNKKSWINNTTPVNRNFYIENVLGYNRIRPTEYDVNDERLVINTKEIDLDINIANAVQHDVWCYVVDNPCLLTGITETCTGFTVTDYSGTVVTLPTTQTAIDCQDVSDNLLYFAQNSLKQNPTQESLPTIECDCGRVFKAYTYDGSQTGATWVTCTSSGLSVYYIYDILDVQGTIINITDSFCLSVIDDFLTEIAYGLYKLKLCFTLVKPFWDSKLGTCDPCCNSCGDESLDFNELLTEPLTNIDTVEEFEEQISSELIDAKNRKTISSYPTLRAIYHRYLNSSKYCENKSSSFTYADMDKFASIVGDYWTDIVEQVIPATTIWGSVKIYSNTIFDDQKFMYKKGSLFTCIYREREKVEIKFDDNIDRDNYAIQNLGPNLIYDLCVDVDITNINIDKPLEINKKVNKCRGVYMKQMDSSSEFIGSVTIVESEIKTETGIKQETNQAAYADAFNSTGVMIKR